jgi:hypothetical protein
VYHVNIAGFPHLLPDKKCKTSRTKGTPGATRSRHHWRWNRTTHSTNRKQEKRKEKVETNSGWPQCEENKLESGRGTLEGGHPEKSEIASIFSGLLNIFEDPVKIQG